TLHTVGKVEQALRPDAESKISKLVRVKLRDRVLHGKSILLMNNTWVYRRAEIKCDSWTQFHMSKNIEELGVNTSLDFHVKDGIYVARVDKPLTNEITARFSATQSMDKAPFKSESDSRIELSYSRGF